MHFNLLSSEFCGYFLAAATFLRCPFSQVTVGIKRENFTIPNDGEIFVADHP